ncbi:beta-galactosidase GalB [Tenacibaculum sp. UWU-22]|uniref:beta-galactosidase GalB n=1 Tax=Tenacibaculum sp. UWU-22 TaxID=3234187 RepID=UPI0034DAE1A5
MINYLYSFFALILLTSCLKSQTLHSDRKSFNDDWLFMKTTDSLAATTKFDDSNWRKLNLPHDWAIEGPFSRENNLRTGGLPVFGEAWYRKYFTLNKALKEQVITLEFDGVMSNSTIYINGQKVYARPNGYVGFEIDITPYIYFDKKNVIAVKVHPEELSSRWYPGAGIYRNVWIESKNKVHIKHWATHIVTQNKEDSATINIKTTVTNNNKIRGAYKIETTVIDEKNQKVATHTTHFKFNAKTEKTLQQELSIKNPKLWSLDSPYLYTANIKVYKENKLIDVYTSTFGIRTIKFTNKGFFLNGKRIKLKGVCLHHDLGPLGAAVNYRATERQLQIMKDMGVNAIRTSHNPASPEQIELCDKMGLLVMEEAFDCWKMSKVKNDYSKYWDEWYSQDLRDMIKRDKNHPSVIMWSIGNEIREQGKKEGYILARKLVAICHEEDSLRPVTAGFNNFTAAIKNGLADEVDIVGANYKPTLYKKTIEQHPNWIIYGSETSSCVSSRGVYYLPIKKYGKRETFQVSSYDVESPSWAYPPDVEFYFQDSIPNVLGEFVWTGFDYLGEPTPYSGQDNFTHGKWTSDWPSKSSYFGAVDLCGFPKDRFYLYQSKWTNKPMIHILPHWNWENTPYKTIPVYCYSNCDEAELFLNGKSLGKKTMGVDKTDIPVKFFAWGKRPKMFSSPYRLSWNVPYEPGELLVIGYKDGKEAVREVIKTVDKPAKVALVADRNTIAADGYDLSFITVKIEDKDANICPLADNKVEFKVTGPATIAAVGNGNAASVEPFQAAYRKAFNGLCLLVVKSKKGEKGVVKIEASSKGLQTATLQIQTE